MKNRVKNFEALASHLAMYGERKRVAVVCAADEHTQLAVARAVGEGLVEVWFVGAVEEVKRRPRLLRQTDVVHYVDAATPEEAARIAVTMAREGKVDVVMKGLMNTDVMLHAVLNKEWGILPAGNVLTHISACQIPSFSRLLFFSDAAVIPYPDRRQLSAETLYLATLCRAIGIEEPRISLVHCTEKVNERIFPHTADYRYICEQAAAGAYGRCLVDGPLDVRTSCDAESLSIKKIDSPLQGRADALVFPDIEAANAFYKTVTLFTNATTACILQGAAVPVALPSRGDSTTSKYYSLVMACAGSEDEAPEEGEE